MADIPRGQSAVPVQADVPRDLDESIAAYQDDFPYALDNRLMLNWYPHRVIRRAKGRSMLELGLGHGYSSLVFSRHFPVHTVIDGSNAVVQRFLGSHPTAAVDIRCAYFEDFVPDIQYENIVMGFILEHVADPGLILRRYREFLAPGGSLFVAVPNCEALNKRLGYCAGLIDSLDTLSDADRLLGHQRLFTVPSLTELCQKEGFSIGSVEGILLKPITTQQMIDLKLSEAILQAMLQVGVDYPELSVGILMELRASS